MTYAPIDAIATARATATAETIVSRTPRLSEPGSLRFFVFAALLLVHHSARASPGPSRST